MVVNRGLTMFWFLIFFWIVRVGSVPIKNFKNTIAIDKDSSTSMGIQHRKGHWVEPPETVQEISGIEQAVVEGDLLLSREGPEGVPFSETIEKLVRNRKKRFRYCPSIHQHMDERLAVDSLWPPIDGITSIPYKLSDSLTERKQTILAAFKMISDPTCIHFHEYTNEQNYLNIIPGKGCASYVGFQGGAQNVFFDSSCSSGNLCHEIMHALGLHHEHTRPDRDSFITIQWEAVVPEKKSNFMIKQGNTQGLAYDTESIMHYGNSYFSTNGNPTIIPKDKGVDMGQRTHLSPLDIIRLNKLYHCGESE